MRVDEYFFESLEAIHYKLLTVLFKRSMAIDSIKQDIEPLKYIRMKSAAEYELIKLGYDPSQFDHIKYKDFN